MTNESIQSITYEGEKQSSKSNSLFKFPTGNNLYRLKIFILSSTFYCSLGPFFVWFNYYSGIGFYIFKFFGLLTILILLTSIDKKNNFNKRVFGAITIFAIFLFLALFTGVKSGTYLPITAIGNIITFTTFALLMMTDEQTLFDSFDLLKTIFTAVLAYTLIIHILVLVGAPIPSYILEANEEGRTLYSGQYYINYLGCLFIQSPIISRMDRFTSVFTEPGVVGTISAFFLVADGFQLKKDRRNIILLIGGLFSISLAFIILMCIAIFLRGLFRSSFRLVSIVLIVFIGYQIFMGINFTNNELLFLQERLEIREDKIRGDNRITEYAEIQYQMFLESDMETVLLGYGKPYENPDTDYDFFQGSATYKRQVFQYGIIGFGIYLLWIFFTPYYCFKSNDKATNNRMIIYIAIFVASIYQRPYLSTLFFLYFLIAGCVYAKYCILANRKEEIAQ